MPAVGRLWPSVDDDDDEDEEDEEEDIEESFKEKIAAAPSSSW